MNKTNLEKRIYNAQCYGNIEPIEMLKTFNCGIGMVICLAPEDIDAAITLLTAAGETVYTIGRVIKGSDAQSHVIYPALI